MVTKMYYDKDADLSLLKNKTIAILGYGSQGHAHAQNLRDSGCKVIVGQRPGGANYDLAVSHGFEPMSGRGSHQTGDLINILLPDEVQGDIYRQFRRPNLQPGNMLMCSHGFNVHFGQVEAPAGNRHRAGGSQGAGPPGAQRVRARGRRALPDRLSEGASEESRKLGLAYAKGVGGAAPA
jgi:ketol-acid reductoisomerase